MGWFSGALRLVFGRFGRPAGSATSGPLCFRVEATPALTFRVEAEEC